MISLKNILLTEAGKENRIIPTRLIAILEKCMGELSKSDEKKITELLAKVMEGITKLNEMPYNYNTMTAWQLIHLAEVEVTVADLRKKLNELQKRPSKKINVETIGQALKALDELYIY
jgi:cell fate regulator YaaT (PSP1 superfamily)